MGEGEGGVGGPRRLPADFMDVVFSWSIEDIFNAELFKRKVEEIPQTFQSVEQYLGSFVFPLLEETRVDFCSSLEKISEAPNAEIIGIKERYNSSRKLIYGVTVKCWKNQSASWKEKHRPLPGDILFISHVSPESVSDFNFYGSTYTFASIIQLDSEDDSHTKLEVGLSRSIDIDGNMGQSLYAIYLFNITTNKRIWRALDRGYGLTSNMSIIEKVLHADPLANAPCDLCPSDASNILANRFTMLNDSQVGAILSSLATAQCNHRPSVQLIWGPPGTGKTQTISELLLILLSMKFRVLTCAPTNVAISEVASRVLTLIKTRKRVERGRISCYSLGDTIVFGNNDRLKIGDDLREIYLDYRVGRLLLCLSPLCGWVYHFSSMIKFLEDWFSLYQIHLESQKEQSTGCTFAEFVTERCTSLIFNVKSHVVCLCTHLTVETLSAENFEILINLLNFLEHFGYQLAQSGLSDEELKKCFWLVRQGSDSNLAHTKELLDGLGKNSIADELYRTGREVLYALKFLRKNLHTPSFRQDEEDQVRYFCLESASLVFCTASSSFQLFFKKKSIELKPLDLLLIDESSQLKESESAIPLQLHGIKHAILVGDQLQLPATVKSEICKKAGFGTSLFERLSSLGHPKHLLEIQYRMHPAISLFPNSKFYCGQIKDGSNVMCKSYEKSYLSGKMYGPYSFIDVVDGKEELDEVGHSRKNMVEVGVVLRIVRNLFNGYSALKQKLSIGILSPYAAQVAEIHEKLGCMYESYGDFVVNVKSIDGCQGGEEDVIIISTVRSNGIGAIGFLSDCQRANVALTRARHCLWIIGNGTTFMKSSSVWESLVLNAKDRQCFFNAGEDKTLAAAILHVKKELDQMEDMLNEHSVLFVNSIWRVLFSDDFKKSFARIRYSQTKKAVMNFLLKLSSGWRPKKYIPVYGSHMQIVKEYKVVGFYVICTTDIKKLSGYTQVLKIWDIKSLSETPELVERLNTILLSYSEEYINLCKARCFDGNLEVPVCWDSGQTVVKFKTLSNSVPCEGSVDSETDGRIFVENSKVSESLLLMKFYSLSSGVVAHLLSSCDGKELDLPFEVSDQEQEIIVYPRSTFILGRSGTGKTTVLSMKLIQKEQQWHLSSEGFNNSSNEFTKNLPRQVEELVKYGEEENFLRQMFVTVSPKLCSAIKNHILRLKSFTCGGDFPPSGSFDMYDIADSFNAFMDIPNSFGCIPRKHYPLVITFEKFLVMLDGTMENSFFEKFHEFGPFHDKTGISNSTASLSLIRQKEVTYSRFTSLYWPHFNVQLTRKLNSSTVFIEIISHIKGGVANGEAIDDFLSRESYCGLSEGRASTLNSDERNVIYDIFLDYEKKKMMNGEFDWSDFVIDLNYRLKLDKHRVREKMDFVYVDEVQDLTMGQISLFRHVCNNFEEGFVFAGDTAQTIARGIDFRFQDIRSLFYNEFHLGSRQEAIVKNKRISDIFHLNQNFRTHDGVLKLAQSVVDILYQFFPQSVDRLCPETSLIFGEAPVLLESGNDENAIMTIFGNRGSVSSGDYANGFGAEQAIIVRDDNSKIEISDLVKKQALVLTIIECKGLEFQDVLLYNFFKDSPLKNQFRVIYDYMQSQNLLDSNTISFPQFEKARHNILCSELKQLYVAITRTRQRLWICDSNSEYSKPMFDYWKKLCLVRVRHLDISLAQAMCVASSKEEWRIRGVKLFNEGNFEMATMCFEKAADSYREKWARASGLRVSAKNLLHSNFEMARVQFTESAELYDSIGKPELAASCYFELKDFRKAGTIYLEKCGDSMLESAGDCFSLAGCSLRAAEVYAKGKCFSKCLSVCSTGNLFDMGLKFIEFWKDSEKSLDLNGSNNEMDELKDSFLEKCALHYHGLEDRHRMMKVVKSFSSAEHARTFLKSRGYLTELLEMEERLGNFLEAASIARLKRDLVLEAKMLEKAGQFEKASELVLFHVVSSLWISGNKGWPMKQFIGKEDLLEKAKSMAERSSDDFYSSVCLETGALGDRENSLADLFNILEASRRINNIVAEVFSSRKALDMHFRADPSKFIWKTEQYTKEILLQNELSTWTLMYMWKSWEEKITHMLLNLQSFETHTETEQSEYWGFCLKYFGVQVNDCQKFALFNPEAYWLKEKNPKILKKDGQLALDAQQFASAAMSYWSSELFSVGLEVVDKLKSLDNFIVRKSMSALYRGEVLVHIFEVSRILLDSEIFGSKSYPKLLQTRNYSKWNFFNDIIFSIDWRLVSKETLIALRDHDLSVKLLKEILVECINRISVKVTYGNVGKVVMLLLVTGKLDEELRHVIGDCSIFPYPWNVFIKQLKDAHSGFEKLIISTNLKNAMMSTFESNWLIEPDYISPQCFLYLAERLLLWLSSCRGNHFITTRALLMESLSCSENVTPGFVDNSRQIMRDEAFNILMNMITQILFDKPATMKWVKKFDVNTSKYYSMLMLRSVVVASLFYLNSGLHFQVLSNSLRRRDIISELPGGFYHCLRNLRKESFLELFASALVTIDDPLVIVTSINGPQILCPHALFVKVGPVYDRDDILGMLSQNNHGFGDQSDGDGVKHEISGNVGSSKDSSQGNKTVDPVLIPDKVGNVGSSKDSSQGIKTVDPVLIPDKVGDLEASTLKEKYTNLCLDLDLLLSEHENDLDTVVWVDPQVKSKVDEFVVELHDAIRCLDQGNLQDGDKLLLRETNTIIDMLKQLSIVLDTRENELESNATMREELLDQIREKMPKVQAFLALLEAAPAAVAVVQHDKEKVTTKKSNKRQQQKKKKKGKK